MASVHSGLLLAALLVSAVPEEAGASDYDAEAALRYSQSAVGRQLGDYAFTDTRGAQVRLGDYAGKPLLISLIYTSCYHTCPVTSRFLHEAVVAAREVLGEDSFEVVSIGFDSVNDTPETLRVFAREQRLEAPGWDLLSASPETIARLTEEVGFVYYPSPRGFDHITQVTVVGRDSRIYAQVYGENFELPWLVEPLKELVFNRPQSAGHLFAGLADRIRLFCTVYDPATGRYQFDYSLFIQIAIGLLVVVSVSAYLVRESRRARA